jgi:uncharacterized membrane protein
VELSARAGDRANVLKFAEYEDRLAGLLFIPAAIIVLVGGIALTFDGPWSFGEDGWVIAGLVLFAAIFLLGIAIIVPAGKKLKSLAASGAPEGSWTLRSGSCEC